MIGVVDDDIAVTALPPLFLWILSSYLAGDRERGYVEQHYGAGCRLGRQIIDSHPRHVWI